MLPMDDLEWQQWPGVLGGEATLNGVDRRGLPVNVRAGWDQSHRAENKGLGGSQDAHAVISVPQGPCHRSQPKAVSMRSRMSRPGGCRWTWLWGGQAQLLWSGLGSFDFFFFFLLIVVEWSPSIFLIPPPSPALAIRRWCSEAVFTASILLITG